MNGNKKYLRKYYTTLATLIALVTIAFVLLFFAMKYFEGNFAGGLLTGALLCGVGFVAGFALIPDMIEYLSLYHASIKVEIKDPQDNKDNEFDAVLVRDYGAWCPLGGSSSRERCDYCEHCKGEYAGTSAKCNLMIVKV